LTEYKNHDKNEKIYPTIKFLCPAGELNELPYGKFSKILVAVDGSQASMDAAEYAIEIAKKDNAQLIALTVSDISFSASIGFPKAPNELREVKEKNELETKDWFNRINKSAEQNKVHLKTELIEREMSIEAEIVEYAQHEGVDLIIIGTKGKSGFKKLVLGSVAAGVVKYATCSVLVIR
jgi:nucleotide-binding universal stress UspA family protein